MSLDTVRNWMYGCTKCGTCHGVANLYLPSCPSGERHQLESFFPSGKLFIGRGVFEGRVSLEDEETRKRIYSCTGCRSCEQQCAVYHHEHIFETVQAIRTEAINQGQLNPPYMLMVDSLRRNDNVFDRPRAERGMWADGLNVKNALQHQVDVLFHAGCTLSFDSELRQTPRLAVELLQRAGLDVGIMGKEETCCGGRAYEIGYLGEFTKYSQHTVESIRSAGAGHVVTACSDCYSAFASLYPREDGKPAFAVSHMVQLLERLLGEGKLKPGRQAPMKVTYHDPCHLGRHVRPGIFEAPRGIINSIPGTTLVEMERNRENAWCCGAGGGVKEAYPELALWTAAQRVDEALATGADAIVTSCPWCERNLKDSIEQSGARIKVMDIIELVAMAVA